MSEGAANYRLVDDEGELLGSAEGIPDLPTDVVPGEFILVPDGEGGLLWYVICDKSRFWDQGRWKIGFTFSRFDPSQMTERQIYENRRKMLQWGGWIDR